MAPKQLARLVTVSALTALWATGAVALAPAEKCEVEKLKTAGKYGLCRLKAEAKAVKTAGVPDYSKCDAKYGRKWERAEGKAGLGVCPSEGDEAAIQSFVAQHTDDVAAALAGGVLPQCATDLATCNAGTAMPADVLSGRTFSSSSGLGLAGTMPDNGAVIIMPGTAPQVIAAGYHNGLGTVAGDADLLANNIVSGVEIFGVTGGALPAQVLRTGQTECDQGAGPLGACPGSPDGQDASVLAGAPRSYTDNGDGTITDDETGLMWEKLSDDGTIHDKDATHSWYDAFTVKIATLNGGGGFAGYTDWRLPNRFELETLLDLGRVNPAIDPVFDTGCTPGCTVLTCSCVRSTSYWSSTSYQDFPSGAWNVGFTTGVVSTIDKDGPHDVRAVRGGG